MRTKLRLPRGPRPKVVKRFLKFHPGLEVMLICPTCGRWVSSIDYLAPYHSEYSKCKICGYFIDQDWNRKEA